MRRAKIKVAEAAAEVGMVAAVVATRPLPVEEVAVAAAART